jgi:hypothetical protein
MIYTSDLMFWHLLVVECPGVSKNGEASKDILGASAVICEVSFPLDFSAINSIALGMNDLELARPRL